VESYRPSALGWIIRIQFYQVNIRTVKPIMAVAGRRYRRSKAVFSRRLSQPRRLSFPRLSIF
jgi:hypothetical protein